MIAEYSNNSVQNIAPGGFAIFTATPIPDRSGMIYHREESGLFRLASPSVINAIGTGCCCCRKTPMTAYLVEFHGNISVPEGGTLEEIQLVLSTDGTDDPSSLMVFTPSAVDVAGNVSAGIGVTVPWICRCASVAIRNPGTQAINLANANLLIDYRGIIR